MHCLQKRIEKFSLIHKTIYLWGLSPRIEVEKLLKLDPFPKSGYNLDISFFIIIEMLL